MRGRSPVAITASLLALMAVGCGDTGASGSGEAAVHAIERAQDAVEQAASQAAGDDVSGVRRSLKTTAGHLGEALAAAEAGDFAAAEEPVGLAENEAREAIRASSSASEDTRDQVRGAARDVTGAVAEVAEET